MPGFIYYLPTDKHAGEWADAVGAGLRYAFPTGQNFHTQHCNNGPDGTGGLVCGDASRTPGAKIKYADRQTWARMPDADVWIGFWTDERPGPDDLARPGTERLRGHLVRLWDGRDWEAPVARGAEEQDGQLVWTVAVPQVATRRDGKWVAGDVVAKYESLWGLAERFNDLVEQAWAETDDESTIVRFTFDDVIEGAVVALSQNYAIGPTEVDMLGLLSEENAHEILLALIDWPTRLAVQKKILEQVDGSPLPDGLAADSPDTGPQ